MILSTKILVFTDIFTRTATIISTQFTYRLLKNASPLKYALGPYSDIQSCTTHYG